MPRNLDGRVELLVPVRNPKLRATIRDEILAVHLRDTAKARLLAADGTYQRVRPPEGDPPFDSQAWMIAHRDRLHADE